MLFPPRGDVGPIIPRLCTGLSSICNTAEVPAPTPHLPTDAPAQPWGGGNHSCPLGASFGNTSHGSQAHMASVGDEGGGGGSALTRSY